MGHRSDAGVSAIVIEHPRGKTSVERIDERLGNRSVIVPPALEQGADRNWLGHAHHLVDLIAAHIELPVRERALQARVYRVIVVHGRARHVQNDKFDLHGSSGAPKSSGWCLMISNRITFEP
jgi:hypothetical protein